MELKFNKNGDAWVAEFEATDKFNLHMEGLLLGSFSILQRTAGGKYTHVRDIPTYPRFDKVFDYDFNALVYPKFIKIVSETEPTYAEVVSDGEITEIKSQTKEVEVTANGTTQVAPDAGYSYLTGVTVKTNVPQSGGSGGEGGMKLLCFNSFAEGLTGQDLLGFLGPFNALVKVTDSDGEGIMPLSVVDKSLVVKSIAVVEGLKTFLDNGNEIIVSRQLIESVEGDLSPFIITEEEFYNLG